MPIQHESGTFERIKDLVRDRKIRFSNHALEELFEELISPHDVISTLHEAEVIEDYPDYWHGPCVLLLQIIDDDPIHVVWGIQRNRCEPAVVVTAYRPELPKWENERTRRKNHE